MTAQRPRIIPGDVWRYGQRVYRCTDADEFGAKLVGIDAPGEVWCSVVDGVPFDEAWTFERPGER
jgi:hypothetical protein